MKATLTFTLPEDREDFDDAVRGSEWKQAVRDVMDELRNRIKYGELPEAEVATLEAVRSMVLEVLDGRGLVLP